MRRIAVVYAMALMSVIFNDMAMAKNQVQVNTVSKPIAASGASEILGSIMFVFDEETEFRDGNRITYDLSGDAVLSHDIDFAIVGSSEGSVPGGGGVFATSPLDTDIDNGIWQVYSGDIATEPGITVIATNGASGIWFRVHGAADTQRVYIDVHDDEDPSNYASPSNFNGNTRLIVGSDTGTKFVLKLFDGLAYDGTGINTGIWALADSDGDGVYGEDGTNDHLQIDNETDNTWGLKTTNRSVSQIKVYLDSSGDLLTFTPTDPEIAHVISSDFVTFYASTNSALPTWPYTSWGTAAHTIQEAIDVASSVDMVLVTNGTYSLTEEITVARGTAVRSVNGPFVTVVDGQNSNRCFNLGNSACALSGFTITNGTAPSGEDGGGVLCDDATPTISRCIVRGNSTTSSGGGIKGGTLSNCLIVNNTANLGGGLSDSQAGHCTIIDNSADAGGGASGGALTNCIVWSNTAALAPNILLSTTVYSCSPDLTHGSDGNITNEPLFVSAATSNYQLQASSPCLDAGTDIGVMDDLIDIQRPLDGDNDGSAAPDMGTYEYLNVSADSDGDGLTDGEEHDTYNTSLINADTDGDGGTDGDEVAAGLSSPTNDNSAGIAFGRWHVTNNPADFNLYTSNSIMDLDMGYLMLAASNGNMNLSLQLKQCTNLVESVWTNAGDAVEWLEPAADGKAFYRVRGE